MDFLKIKKSIKLAFSGLGANKARTGLSVLGIVIGVAAVIMIVSVGQGLQAFILGQLSSFGSDILSVQPKVPGSDYENSISSMGQGVVITSLKSSDAEALRDKDRFPYIEAASGYSSAQEWAVYREEEKRLLIIAADSYYPKIDAMTIVENGRFFTEQENKNIAKVIVIGSDIAEEFFGSSDPVGKNIRIKDNNYEVIGVLKERGAVLSFNMDELVIVPVKTSQKLIQGIDHIQEIGIKLTDDKYLNQAKAEIVSLMDERHDIDSKEDRDFVIITMDEALTTIDSITNTISLLLGLLAAISLFVGGIGIMNIMLVIVAERTKEIGLRKALGARYRDIMQQFIFEAVAISLLGGFIGIVIGISMSFVASQVITRYGGLEWPFVVSYSAVMISFLVAAFFGIVFGWYPAKEAAKLNPIDALRKS